MHLTIISATSEISRFIYIFILHQSRTRRICLQKLHRTLLIEDLHNPTSGGDASHPQYISMRSQVGCTHQVSKTALGAHFMALPFFGPALKEGGEGGGFPLNPRRRLFVEERISPLEGIICFGNGPRRQMPPAWICSISHRGELPPTHSL